jgi:branched-chain amino acid aminotransferase
LTEHSQRLIESARLLGMHVPYTVGELDRACLELIERNEMQDGYLRPVAWRGSEQMGVGARATTIRVAVASWDWPVPYTADAETHGIKLLTSSWRRPLAESAPVQAKAAGLYVICTMSKHWAEEQGADDALMLDARGYVAEATVANIFMTSNGVLHTPTPDCFLNGITRQTVIELARQRGIEVIERTILPRELHAAEEVFLTGTAAEVLPVRQIDSSQFVPGEITRALRKDYLDLVHGRLALANAGRKQSGGR